jgi:hypothetical protein
MTCPFSRRTVTSWHGPAGLNCHPADLTFAPRAVATAALNPATNAGRERCSRSVVAGKKNDHGHDEGRGSRHVRADGCRLSSRAPGSR